MTLSQTQVTTIAQSSLPEPIQQVSFLSTEVPTRTYRINTEHHAYLFRCSRYEEQSNQANLTFMSDKLNTYRIPYPRLIAKSTVPSTECPFGWRIFEWIEGIPALRAVEQRLVTRADIAYAIGVLLKQVHQVAFSAFGRPPFSPENPGTTTFRKYELQPDPLRRLERLVQEGSLSQALLDKAFHRIHMLLPDIQQTPVLVNGSVNFAKCIWTGQGIVLPDWDEMRATSWACDLGRFFYWHGDFENEFFAGYGPVPSTDWSALKAFYQTQYALRILPYYVFDNPDRKQRAETLQRLESLVEQPL